MSNLWVKVKATRSDKAGKLLHAQTSARHEAATNVLVTHANAPLNTRNIDVVTRAKVIDVANLSTRLESLNSILKGLAAATVDADAVNALATGKLHNLLPDWTVLVRNEIGCAVALSCLNANWTGTNSDDARSTMKCSTSNGHQAYRSNADD